MQQILKNASGSRTNRGFHNFQGSQLLEVLGHIRVVIFLCYNAKITKISLLVCSEKNICKTSLRKMNMKFQQHQIKFCISYSVTGEKHFLHSNFTTENLDLKIRDHYCCRRF